MVFTKRKVQVQAVIKRVRVAVKEVVSSMVPKEGSMVQKVPRVWKAPTKGWYKINYDGGFMKKNGLAGIGVVVGNVDGALVYGVCKAVMIDYLLVVEALTVRRGLRLAIEKMY